MQNPRFDIEELQGWDRLTFDFPPFNMLDFDAVLALEAYFKQRPSHRPLLMTGLGGGFSAGVDRKAFKDYPPEMQWDFQGAITRMTAALCAQRSPVIAALNGHAKDLGFVLALCADYRIAAQGDAQFGLTEAHAGVPMADGPAAVVEAEIPVGLRRHMTLCSAAMPAAALVGHLVIDEIAPADMLMPQAYKQLQELAKQKAFAAVKAQMRGALQARLADLALRAAP